jgi:hypothetical protein
MRYDRGVIFAHHMIRSHAALGTGDLDHHWLLAY